jgi:hemolysin III
VEITQNKEERANALSHGLGILIGIVGGGYLLHIAINSNNSWAVTGMLLYLFGMLASYVCSTLYHATPPSPRKDLLRKFDHAAIYLYIAGSYSPITLVTLREVGYWGWSIFIFVWLCAIIGVIVSFYKLKAHSHLKTICYVAMACSILIAFKPLSEVVPIQFIYWLMAEAFFYITGAVLYSLYKVPYMHFVFHLFVLGGTICHMMVLWYVL